MGTVSTVQRATGILTANKEPKMAKDPLRDKYAGDGPKVDKRHQMDAKKWSESGRWVKVKSSNVESVMYDEDQKELFVKFLSGSTYKYRGISVEIAQELFKSPSIGKFLNTRIKGIYQYEGPL